MTSAQEKDMTFIEAIDPGMKQMDAARQPFGTQDRWATKEDHYRFGWNACRAEILNRAEVAIASRDAEIASEREARHKLDAALRTKDHAMDILFARLRDAGVDYSDLIP